MIKTELIYLQRVIAFIALSIAVPNSAFAELELSGTYAGFLYSTSDYSLDADVASNDRTENWGHLKVKYGRMLNDVYSVEGQLGIIDNTNADHGVATYGVYLRVGKDMGQYKPYAMLGYSGFYLYSDNVDTKNQSELGFSYGVGLEIFGSKDLTVTFEYLSVLNMSADAGDLSFTTLGLGFTYYYSEDKSYFNKNSKKIRSIRY